MVELIYWTILFIAASSQGFLLAFLVIFKNNKARRAHIYLGSFLLTFSTILLFWVGYWHGIHFEYPYFSYIFYPLPFLLGPFIYLYVKSFSDETVPHSEKHFMPFLVVSLYSTALVVGIPFSGKVQTLIFALHSVSYFFYTTLLLKELKLLHSDNSESLNQKDVGRLRAMINMFGLFATLSTVNFILNRVLELPVFIDLIVAVVACILVYLIGYIGLNDPLINRFLEKKKIISYSSSTLDKKSASELMKVITEHIELTEPFLNYKYRLQDLSNETQIPSHYISEVLNKYFSNSFPELINTYRVEKAKEILLDKNRDYIKTLIVGYEVGFNSTSTFYYWFKKITGKSPKDFRDYHN